MAASILIVLQKWLCAPLLCASENDWGFLAASEQAGYRQISVGHWLF